VRIHGVAWRFVKPLTSQFWTVKGREQTIVAEMPSFAFEETAEVRSKSEA
jgi:hypothetical protein